MVEGRIVDSNIDGFSSLSGNLFAVLVYYLKGKILIQGSLLEMLCM